MKILSVSCIAGALAAMVMVTPASAGGDPDYRAYGKGHGYHAYKGGHDYYPAKPRYAPVYRYNGPTTYTTYPQVSTYSYTYAVPTYTYSYPTYGHGYAYAGRAYPSYGYVRRGCRKVRRRWCGCNRW